MLGLAHLAGARGFIGNASGFPQRRQAGCAVSCSAPDMLCIQCIHYLSSYLPIHPSIHPSPHSSIHPSIHPSRTVCTQHVAQKQVPKAQLPSQSPSFSVSHANFDTDGFPSARALSCLRAEPMTAAYLRRTDQPKHVKLKAIVQSCHCGAGWSRGACLIYTEHPSLALKNVCTSVSRPFQNARIPETAISLNSGIFLKSYEGSYCTSRYIPL